MKKLIMFSIISLNFLFSSFAQKADNLFDSLLKDYVKEGIVDYKSLSKDPRLKEYIRTLSSFDPETLASRDEKLAFWINAYNAYTLKAVVDKYPVKSIKDLNQSIFQGGKSVWDQDLVVINNKKMTLNHIEHKIIRPEFSDPRVHFALVCAAISCPPLRSEAYKAEILNDQLDDQGSTFLRQGEENSFNLKMRQARVSPIFKWYKKDFAKNPQGLLIYLSNFLPDAVAKEIKLDPDNWKVTYSDYNWSLNGY